MKVELQVLFIITLCIIFVIGTTRKHDHRRLQKSKIHRKLMDFQLAKESVSKSANLIYQRFEFYNKFRYQFYLASINLPDFGWDLLKYKFAKKILDKSDFVMVFGGSSVTAGHDNYYNESYPFVVERRLKPSFDALGVKLDVRNIAQGANNCRPYCYCYESMGGLNPDWIGWEQSYNCGKDKAVFEIMARVAMWAKAVIFYSASGAFSPNECKPSTDPVPWISENWDPSTDPIAQKIPPYSPSTESIQTLKKVFDEWYDDGIPPNGGAAARFAAPLGGHYNGAAPHGFSVWTQYTQSCQNEYFNETFKGTAYDLRSPCLDQGGLHWMTQEASVYSAGHGKSWHPPRGLHLLRGEFIAYAYLHVLLDAMLMVETDLNDKKWTVETAIKEYETRLNSLLNTPQFPEDPFYCSGEDCREKPLCYTNYEPNFNPSMKLENYVIGKHEGWTLNTPPVIPNEIQYGYKDRRPAYQAMEANKEIYLKVNLTRSDTYITVCGYEMKDSLKHASFYLDMKPNALDTMYTPPPIQSETTTTTTTTTTTSSTSSSSSSNPNLRIHLASRKYINDECTKLTKVPGPGLFVLTIKTNHDHPSRHATTLSHIIISS